MLKRILKAFSILSGGVLMIGAAGAADTGSEDFKTILTWCIISLILIVIGLRGMKEVET